MRKNVIIAGLTVVLMGLPVLGKPAKLARSKAELMGRAEQFFMHNFKDVTWRKSLEWGEVERNEDGTRSIRYMYEARIWDKKTMVMNQVFTFARDGAFVRYENVEGFGCFNPGGDDRTGGGLLRQQLSGYYQPGDHRVGSGRPRREGEFFHSL